MDDFDTIEADGEYELLPDTKNTLEDVLFNQWPSKMVDSIVGGEDANEILEVMTISDHIARDILKTYGEDFYDGVILLQEMISPILEGTGLDWYDAIEFYMDLKNDIAEEFFNSIKEQTK